MPEPVTLLIANATLDRYIADAMIKARADLVAGTRYARYMAVTPDGLAVTWIAVPELKDSPRLGPSDSEKAKRRGSDE